MFENGSGTASVSQAFVHHFGQVILQFEGTGDGDLEYEDLSHRYLWGPAIDMLLATEEVDWTDEDADGEVLWALTDHLGTPRDWIDNEANVVDHAIYDSYGNRLNADAVDAAFEWTGKYRDPLTGLQLNGERWYDPAIQRWMSEDPIGFTAGDPNLGRYSGNSPTMYTDPYGLDPVTIGGGPSVPIEQIGGQGLPFGVMAQIVGGYRGGFIKETPDLPKDWEVHHRYQQRLRERYRLERGINVDAVEHLRGIDPELHKEINAIQTRWWKAKAREVGVTVDELMDTISLDKVDELITEIDAAYDKLWVKAGAKAAEIKKVKDRVAAALKRVTDRGSRITGVLNRTGTALGALGIFAFIGQQATVANQIANPNPLTQQALDEFLNQYEYSLNEALQHGTVGANRLNKLNAALAAWLKALGVDPAIQSAIYGGLLKEELNLPR